MSVDIMMVATNISEQEMEIYCSNIIGSRYFNLGNEYLQEEKERILDKLYNSSHIILEEAVDSMLMETEEIIQLIDDSLPIIDNNLIDKIMSILRYKSTSQKIGYWKWLCDNRGKKLVIVAW